MRFFSMFSGIGGFDLAFQRHGHECAAHSEIDKYAIKVYENHFQEVENYGDATKINPAELPEFDLLCGGFPCQSFSIAGKRGGFEDTRGTLFFEIARVCKERRPKLLLLENVKGLLSHDNGRTFGTILHTLGELGYWWEFQVLNSKNFGVPQNRERVFIVGHLAGGRSEPVFPLREGNSEVEERRERIPQQNFPTIFASQHKIARGMPMIMVHGGVLRKGEFGNGLKEECSFTLDGTCGRDLLIPEGHNMRRLTEVECERLQGFPDNWTEGISSTQRYKCLGNAVTVNVVEEIVKRL